MGEQGYTPPPTAIDAAERASALGRGSTDALSLAGIEVHEALTGARELTSEHVAAMASHPYDPDSLNGLLFGGESGARWARTVVAAVDDPVDLDALSAELARVDLQFKDRVEQVLAQAMRTALRRADVKVKVRSRSRVVTAAALAPHMDAIAQQCYPPQLLASLRTTPDELLHESFTDAADQVGLLFLQRQDARRRALERQLDVEAEQLAMEQEQEDERRRGAIAAFVAGAMYLEAVARLSQPRNAPVFDARGEQPVDPYVSPRITADVVKVGNGSTLAPPAEATAAPTVVTPPAPGTSAPVPPPATAPATPVVPRSPVGAESRLFDYTDDVVTDIVRQFVPKMVVEYEWTVGGPINPFRPHHRLAGRTATEQTFWTVFAKDPSDFPEGEEAWFPQDHAGCQCDLVSRYVVAD